MLNAFSQRLLCKNKFEDRNAWRILLPELLMVDDLDDLHLHRWMEGWTEHYGWMNQQKDEGRGWTTHRIDDSSTTAGIEPREALLGTFVCERKHSFPTTLLSSVN